MTSRDKDVFCKVYFVRKLTSRLCILMCQIFDVFSYPGLLYKPPTLGGLETIRFGISSMTDFRPIFKYLLGPSDLYQD